MRLRCRFPVDLAKGNVQTSTKAAWLTASCLLRGNQRRLHVRGAPIRREGVGAVWAPCSGPAHLTSCTFPTSLAQVLGRKAYQMDNLGPALPAATWPGLVCRCLLGMKQLETPGRCAEW